MDLSRIINGGRKLLERDRLIRASGYFDPDWYAETYPEAGGAARALHHFMEEGATKGHDPGPAFSSRAYLDANPDVKRARLNPLLHYLRFGQAEGRAAPPPPATARNGYGLGRAALARVRETFDADFYRATNPDLPEETDAFAHFMETGWREGRDPAPWFSCSQYLRAHRDIAASGRNPFAHYLISGCREGRAHSPSRRPRPTVSTDTVSQGRLRTAALAMVRNERDIIRAFSGHLLALFDDIVIVDHRSDDGTREFLDLLAAGCRRVRVLGLDEPSYIQSVAMTHMVRTDPVLRQADWVFILDADEFLPFEDRTAFEAALTRYARCPVIEMRWKNLVPETYWDGEVELGSDTRFLAPTAPSPFRKIAFQPARIALDRTVVAQGNHALVETLNGIEVSAFAADFPLLHLPVRSVDQLLLKLNQGVHAYQKIGRGRDKGQGTHWYQMKEATEKLQLTPEFLNAIVERYSEDKPALAPRPAERLLAEGHERASFRLARQEIDVDDLPGRSLGELLMRLYADEMADAASEDTVGVTRLETRQGRLIRSSDDPGAEYGPLPASMEELEPAPMAALAQLMQVAERDIEDLVPSEIVGHIPFLMAVAALARPRRYVELGTLRGASFFAFCQAARQAGFETEAVAVSSWSVEPERQAEYPDLFENFRYIAAKYADFAGVLRGTCEAAAARFADCSVDLLLLDGFREARSLEDTLEIWLPKLSDRGVLLLHDTNAFGPGFGVWRVWEQLVERHPSLTFRHAQGLGLSCVGPNAPAALRVLAGAATDPNLLALLQNHFDARGRSAAELFSRRYDMARMELRAGAEGADAEELTWLRQELASAKTEVEALRNMLRQDLRDAAGA